MPIPRTYYAPFEFEGDKISKLTINAKAVDFEQLRFQHRAL